MMKEPKRRDWELLKQHTCGTIWFANFFGVGCTIKNGGFILGYVNCNNRKIIPIDSFNLEEMAAPSLSKK